MTDRPNETQPAIALKALHSQSVIKMELPPAQKLQDKARRHRAGGSGVLKGGLCDKSAAVTQISRAPAGWYLLNVVPSSRTIALVTALKDAGIEAWTPVETVKGEPPTLKEFEKPRRQRKVAELITRPLLPSLVFARSEHLAELVAMAHSPTQTYHAWDSALRRMVTKGMPFFRIFRPDARPITDAELDGLRRIEARRKPRGSVTSFKPGDRVKMTEGAYGGLRGVVVAVRKKAQVTIRIAGSPHDFDVQAWILMPDIDTRDDIHHYYPKSEQVPHAKAA